jgi:hypothetical protein
LRRRFTTENKKTQGESERPASIDGIPWVCATTIATTTRSRKKRRFSFSSSLFYWYRLRECGTAHGQPSPPPPQKKKKPDTKEKEQRVALQSRIPNSRIIHNNKIALPLPCSLSSICCPSLSHTRPTQQHSALWQPPAPPSIPPLVTLSCLCSFFFLWFLISLTCVQH